MVTYLIKPKEIRLNNYWILLTIVPLIILTTIIIIQNYGGGGEKRKKLVCYYNFPVEGASDSLQPDHIDPYQCTHINLAFLTIRNHTIQNTLNPYQIGVIHKLNDLKMGNPDLKVLLSIGGGGGGGSGFAEMVQTHQNRKTFIRSVLDAVRLWHIDGIDLDWEYPEDKHRTHFTQLLLELRKAFEKFEVDVQKTVILSVAVPSIWVLVVESYDVPYLNRAVDYVNVMAYDYHFYRQMTPFTGLNSPLYAVHDDLLLFPTFNINYSLNFWLEMGMDREKLILGLPAYGHSFELVNWDNTGLYAPAKGYGRTLGNFVLYPKICECIKGNLCVEDHFQIVYVANASSFYMVCNYEWLAFDNETSLKNKVTYVKTNGFGGVMVYSLNADDYRGVCDGRRLPLTNSIKEELLGTEE